MNSDVTAEEVAAIHRGDRDVLRRLIAGYSPRRLAVTRSFADDLDDAHDLLQDVWLRIYEKRTDFRGSGTFLGWALSVCRNVCIDRVQQRATRSRLLDAGVERVAKPFDVAADDLTHRGELRRALRKALMELPPRERDVVILRLLEGRTVRETAHRLKCAEGTVKATLHHALTKLRSSMEVWAR